MRNTLNLYVSVPTHSTFSYKTALQFAELKRLERDHAKEKQKLVKDKDAGSYHHFVNSHLLIFTRVSLAKGQLSKANQTKTKMESLARELQKV